MKKALAILFIIVFMFSSLGFASPAGSAAPLQSAEGSEEISVEAEKNGDIYILFTSDVHCGIEEGFGYAGLWEIRSRLESQGYETILVDDGDSIQGEVLGSMDKGETMIDFMNTMK